MRDRQFFGSVIAMVFLAVVLHLATGTTKAAPTVPPCTTQQAAPVKGVTPQGPYGCPCGRTCVAGVCWCQSCLYKVMR